MSPRYSEISDTTRSKAPLEIGSASSPLFGEGVVMASVSQLIFVAPPLGSNLSSRSPRSRRRHRDGAPRPGLERTGAGQARGARPALTDADGRSAFTLLIPTSAACPLRAR